MMNLAFGRILNRQVCNIWQRGILYSVSIDGCLVLHKDFRRTRHRLILNGTTYNTTKWSIIFYSHRYTHGSTPHLCLKMCLVPVCMLCYFIWRFVFFLPRVLHAFLVASGYCWMCCCECFRTYIGRLGCERPFDVSEFGAHLYIGVGRLGLQVCRNITHVFASTWAI